MTTTMVYWKVKARGWAASVIARVGKVPFVWDDATANTWPATKDLAPFGQLPYIEFGGHRYAQSAAIYRILARKGQLEGADDAEFAMNQQLVEEHQDLVTILGSSMHSKDDNKWVEGEKKVRAQLAYVEKLIGANGRFTPSKLCVGDILMVCITNVLISVFGQSILSETPKLAAFYEANKSIIAEDESIGHYYKK